MVWDGFNPCYNNRLNRSKLQ